MPLLVHHPSHSRSIYLTKWKNYSGQKSNYVFLKFSSILFYIEYYKNFKKNPYEFERLKVFYTIGKLEKNILNQGVYSIPALGHLLDNFEICLGKTKKNYFTKEEMFNAVVAKFWQSRFGDYDFYSLETWQALSKNKNFNFVLVNKGRLFSDALRNQVQLTTKLSDINE